MNIGDLFLSLGVQPSAEFKNLPNELRQIGVSAAKAMQMLGGAAERGALSFERMGSAGQSVLGQLASSAKNAGFEARIAAGDFRRMGSAAVAAANEAGKASSKAQGVAAKIWAGRGGRGPGFGVLGEDGQNDMFGLRRGPKNSWAGFMAGAPGVGEGRGGNASNPYARLVGGSGGGNINWAGKGDPFNIPQPGTGGGGGPKKPGFLQRMAAMGGDNKKGGGSGGGGGYNRFGPLGQASMLRRVILGAGIYQGATFFGQLADTYAQLNMRLVGLTGSQEKATSTFERLRGVARDTNSSLESTTEAYVRIRNATVDMKLSEEDTYKLMTNLNLLFATSGASATEAKAGMMQLTQAFAKGKLDGDEFRTMAEDMPNILKVLEKSLGKNEGQLRAMSKAGQITRAVMVKAFMGVQGLQKPVDTFSTTWQKFKDNLMVTAGTFAQQNHLVERFADLLNALGPIMMAILDVTVKLATAFADFIQGLKDGKIWAIALAGVIGLTLLPSVVSLVTWLLRIPAILKAVAAGRWAGMFKDILGVGEAYGAGKVAAGAAGGDALAAMGGGAGATKGAAQGAAEGAVKGIGWSTALLAGLTPLVIGLGVGEALNAILGPSTAMADLQKYSDTPEVQAQFAAMSDFQDRIGKGENIFSAAQAAGANNSVQVGTLNVEIKANDMTDAQKKFGESWDNLLRGNVHAGGQ